MWQLNTSSFNFIFNLSNKFFSKTYTYLFCKLNFKVYALFNNSNHLDFHQTQIICIELYFFLHNISKKIFVELLFKKS
jgi:hypothetical protein